MIAKVKKERAIVQALMRAVALQHQRFDAAPMEL
jgi:hypothetical protein